MTGPALIRVASLDETGNVPAEQLGNVSGAGSGSGTNTGLLSVLSITSSGAPSVAIGTYNELHITALAVPITSLTITGSPVDGQPFIFRCKDNGTARAIALGAAWIADGEIDLPTTTVPGKTLMFGAKWDSAASKWAVLVINGGY